MAARHRTRGVLASRALTSRSTANASARDAPGTVLRQHRKSFVPNIATIPIRSAVAAFFAVGVLGASAAVDGTNTWIGASSGGDCNWNVAANWRSVRSDGTVNEDATTTFNGTSHYVYDFSSLADGAEVLNDCTAPIRIAGLLFGANQGTVTLTRSGGKDFYFSKSGGNVIHVGAGTTVSFNLQHGNKWNDDGAVLNFAGGGDFQFAMDDLGLVGGATFNLDGGTTVSVMKTPNSYLTGFYMSTFCFLDSASTLNVQADDVRFMAIKSAAGRQGRVALNGHTAGIVFGGGSSIAEIAFDGYFDGPGALYVQGGNALKFTNAEAFRNGAVLKVKTDEIAFGGGAALGSGTALEMADNGRVAVDADQTVKALKGGGTMGAVTVADGKALTVGTSASTGIDTYSARIRGDGRLVKDGANYTLALDGVNTYAGGTEVKAGTLVVKSPESDPVPDGLVAYWKFDDPNDLGKDSSGRGVALTSSRVTGSAGVLGGAAHLVQADNANLNNGAYLKTASTLGAAGLPTGNHAISFAYWIKIAKSRSDLQTSLYGTWALAKMFLFRQSGDSLKFTSGADACDLASGKSIKDGKWHHVVGTYDGSAEGRRTIYFDGMCVASGVNKPGITMDIAAGDYLTIGTTETRDFEGDIDDCRIYDRELTADEVAVLYSSPTVPAGRIDEAASLPKPVAKYTFDDSANQGKDTSGNGYDLTQVGTVFHAAARKGAFGGCVKLSTTGYFKAETFPAKVPTSGSFTLSLRVQPAGVSQPAYVFWGTANSTAAYSFFYAGANNNPLLEQVASFTTGNDVCVGELFTTANGCSDATGNEVTWLNMVYVYDCAAKTLKAYRDGNLVASKSNYASTFAASPEVFYLGFRPKDVGVTADTYANCYFDDVRIFDQTLSDRQVKTLVRSLETGSVGAPMPSAGTVTVDAGATLKTTGAGNVIPSLSGAGTLDVGYFGSTTVGDPSGFSGAVTGLGSLYVGGSFGNSDLSGFGGFVSLADGFNVTTDNAGRNLPAVSRLTGTVTIPSTGMLTFTYDNPTDLTTRKFVIAEAENFVLPSDFNGWQVAPANDFYSATFLVEEGDGVKRFVAKMKYKRGLMLLFK